MKRWLSALIKIADTTRQVEISRKDIQRLDDYIKRAQKEAELLRTAVLESDNLNNKEFDQLVAAVSNMDTTLTTVIQVQKDGDIKDRLVTLRRGIKRATTIRTDKRSAKRRSNESF